MSDIAIKVENLGKSYLVGHNNAKADRYTALRDVIARNARNMARKTRDMVTGRPIVQGDEIEEFWALKDLNFEIKQGDRIGIIGRNGAGKSTLLKILSRITEPTKGKVLINGRLSSLLEVGTGFHPELSGRENIFLNGAILGMPRTEINKKLDEIIEFSEIENFLDTPVKRYSSGMYVRLAFSVAAHLEPDILIIDEVLAVGDADFQKKCIKKLSDTSHTKRTVIIVSHNSLAIQRLCDKTILLEHGRLKLFSSTEEALAKYHESPNLPGYQGATLDTPCITALEVLTNPILIDAPAKIRIEWNIPPGKYNPKIGIGLNTLDGIRIFDSSPLDRGIPMENSPGRYAAVITIPQNTLAPRVYSISAGIWEGSKSYHHVENCVTLSPVESPVLRFSHQATYDGLLFTVCDWELY